MKKLIVGKKGASLGGWMEGIVLISIFLFCLSGVVVEMNRMYEPTEDVDIGLISQLSAEELESNTTDYVDSSQTTLGGATVEKGGDGGLSFLDAWTLTYSMVKLVFHTLSGGWIYTILVEYIGLSGVIAGLIRALWVIGIIFGIVKLFMKVSP